MIIGKKLNMKINIPVSVGELIDKITILEIKLERIKDIEKIKNVKKEYTELKNIENDLKKNKDFEEKYFSKLKQVNIQLWNIEDEIRIFEKNKNFDDNFLKLARSVYKLNDERSVLKRKINLEYGSEYIEEKDYEEY